ncbi:MAG: ATP-dependent helicase [Silvanigrellales bacterium]|nr:ATP-dependent helicase [Silvanigrellales bacterium]
MPQHASLQRLLAELNPEQREAASTLEGPLLVLAGAGTGKTKVITTRIAHMIAVGIEPERIVAVSFTNKAASEMQERLAHFTGRKVAERATLSTFHSFALSLVRRFPSECGLSPRFGIADEGQSRALLKEAIQENKLDELVPLPSAVERISQYKDLLFTDADFDKSNKAFDRAMMRPLFSSYNRRLRLYNLVDFDDLVYLAALLLRNHPKARQEIQEDLHYLLVDEYQDTSTGQLELVRLLAGERRNVCVVGDDDQSIYSWRGARPDVIFEFLRHFPEAKNIKLEQNYRCAPNILAAANAVIAENEGRLGKTLWSRQKTYDRIRLHAAENERDEALHVAGLCQELVEKHGYAWQDFAILVRSNKQSVPFEQLFEERKIPYHVHGGTRMFDRKEVRDLFAYVKLAYNPRDLNALFRVINLPSRHIGLATLEKLKGVHAECASRNPQASGRELLDRALEEVGETHEGVREYLGLWRAAAARFDGARTREDLSGALRHAYESLGLLREITVASGSMQVANFRKELVERVFGVLDKVELAEPTLEAVVDALNLDENRFSKGTDTSGKLQIMSMHASKGLEFPVVFLVGLEEGVLPHERSMDVAHGESEERRLFYVALTRAKHRLFLSHCGFRRKGKGARAKGGEKDPEPSRFLKAIPEELLEVTETDAGAEEARRMEAAKKLFEMFR